MTARNKCAVVVSTFFIISAAFVTPASAAGEFQYPHTFMSASSFSHVGLDLKINTTPYFAPMGNVEFNSRNTTGFGIAAGGLFMEGAKTFNTGIYLKSGALDPDAAKVHAFVLQLAYGHTKYDSSGIGDVNNNSIAIELGGAFGNKLGNGLALQYSFALSPGYGKFNFGEASTHNIALGTKLGVHFAWNISRRYGLYLTGETIISGRSFGVAIADGETTVGKPSFVWGLGPGFTVAFPWFELATVLMFSPLYVNINAEQDKVGVPEEVFMWGLTARIFIN